MRATRPSFDTHTSERDGNREESRLRLIGRTIIIGLCALACVVALSLHAERVAAAGYTVNVPTDTGTGSGTTGDLRYAITQVDNGAGTGDTITITATGTITLTSALPALLKPVAITGPGAATLTVDGNHMAGLSLFFVNTGVTASISNLTIANGNTFGGGGIYNNGGMLTVTNTTLSGNSASDGGGIFSNGTLTVASSTFSGNSATGGQGGGIASVGTLTVTNCTFSGNSAAFGGGINNVGLATVTNSTFSGNSATGNGGGISNISSTVNLTNTIVAGNTAPFGPDIAGPIGSNGHNLIGDTSGSSGFVASDLQNRNPLLDTLASNGGPTQTFALLAGSPAIGAGDPTVCASTTVPAGAPVGGKDQRGLPRPATRCAIGAFEPQQATYTVGSNSDTGAAGTQAQCLDPNNTACRLRDAIGDATSGIDTIVFNSTGRGTITVGSTLTLAASVTITGPTSGAGVVVDGGNAVQVFLVNSGVMASISNLTIAHGNTGNSDGGGIQNNGTLTLTSSTLSGNSNRSKGAGIRNDGTLTVTNSTLSGNSGSEGGGIYNNGTLFVTNSTFSGNSAGVVGGGISSSRTQTVTNTIVAGNTSPTGPDIAGPIGSNGHNLIGDTSGSSGFVASDLQNRNPLLDTLASNGGPTQTFALLAGSPAIGAGDPTVCASTTVPAGAAVGGKDQRGLPRPPTTCAIGAFEPQSASPTITLSPAILPNGTVGVAYSQTITATGGTAPYVFAVTLGTPPTGLTLATTGALSGTPSATGTFTFTVQATDATSLTGTQQYTVTITATGATLTSIALTGPGGTPPPATLKVGQMVQLTATGTYSDGSTQNLNGQVQWSSSNPNVVKVDATGTVTGVSPGGPVTITATQGSVAGQTTVTVAPVILTGVAPAPAPAGRSSGASAPSVPTGGSAVPAPAPPSR